MEGQEIPVCVTPDQHQETVPDFTQDPGSRPTSPQPCKTEEDMIEMSHVHLPLTDQGIQRLPSPPYLVPNELSPNGINSHVFSSNAYHQKTSEQESQSPLAVTFLETVPTPPWNIQTDNKIIDTLDTPGTDSHATGSRSIFGAMVTTHSPSSVLTPSHSPSPSSTSMTSVMSPQPLDPKYFTIGCGDKEQIEPQKHKPKRKRIISKGQRTAANHRERKRMVTLNDAFDILKERIPTFSHEKKLSRIETLRLAMAYINFMKQLIDGQEGHDVTSGLPYSTHDNHPHNLCFSGTSNYNTSDVPSHDFSMTTGYTLVPCTPGNQGDILAQNYFNGVSSLPH